jgi:hypothetical protein
MDEIAHNGEHLWLGSRVLDARGARVAVLSRSEATNELRTS